MAELWLPENVERGSSTTGFNDIDPKVASALRRGLAGPVDPDPNEVAHMDRVRTHSSMGLSRTANQGSIQLSLSRPRDPMWYWEQNNEDLRFWQDEKILAGIRAYCRMVYMTHPIVASAIDIFSAWPLQEMELTCKDPALTDFYEDLFMDQLDYPEHLVDFGREYWTAGEGISLGSFNEILGVWEDDELIDPDDVKVIRSPFMKEPRYEMRLPRSIREVLEKREPAWEYNALIRSYPELAQFTNRSDEHLMPVSNVLLRRIKFKGHSFSERGLPILMRAWRTLVQEEMLNAAFDAVAERLYTPLILVRLGASATDLGTNSPWIPTSADITAFNNNLDAALAADFRVLTHHFAVNMENVLGREMLPRAQEDFARIDNKLLQTFGISSTMLTGANRGETYAADALNFELVSQLLARYQRLAKKHYRERALVVAEAQGHYDYEVRNGKRYPVMEEVLEVDEETGEQRIIERPKLLVPELHIRQMNFQTEKDQRQLVEALASSGIPISHRSRLVNVDIDLEEERERRIQEAVADAIAAQEARRQSYLALKADGLPIPEDLERDFGPKAKEGEPVAPTTPEVQEPLPSIGVDQITDNSAILSHPEEDQPSGEGNVVRKLPRNLWLEEMEGTDSKSDERRDGMPGSAAVLRREGSASLTPLPPLHIDPAALDEEGKPLVDDDGNLIAGSLQLGPRHIGRRLSLDKDRPLDDQLPERTG